MATRGSQKKTNATKSMKELTKLEKAAEARSEKRKANVARNKAAGNAGLSSKRLNRMEAEYERKSAERRAARSKPAASSTMKVDPNERIAKPDTKAASSASRLGKIARGASRVAGPVGLASTAIGALGMLAPKDGVNKTERMKKDEKKVGTGSAGPSTRQSNRTDSKKVGTGSSGPSSRQSNKTEKKPTEKNYNVGVSKGGVSFNEAFRHFRNKGAKEFTWNGKKYTTKLKEEK